MVEFIYLIRSIENDIQLSLHCPINNYPQNAPSYLTVCLIDNPNNHMYPFIVKPIRSKIEDAIKNYNQLLEKKSYLKGLQDFKSKFLQKRNTSRIRIEHIKYLFVLELVQLLRLRNMRINSPFLQTLLLNRLFSLSLVVDKLLNASYRPNIRIRGKGPQMWECVTSTMQNLLTVVSFLLGTASFILGLYIQNITRLTELMNKYLKY